MNRCVVVNGSPKAGTGTCNSSIIIKHFLSYMDHPYPVIEQIKQEPTELADELQDYEAILFVFPLYIHAMPGTLMELFERLQPARKPQHAIGFIVQAGFIESRQQSYLEAYLAQLTEKLGYRYLGCITKGEAAGIYMVPRMFKKVLKQFALLGRSFEERGAFDPILAKQLAHPYTLSKAQLIFLKLFQVSGLNNIGWHTILKRNGAYQKRRDQPFLKE